MNNAGHLKFPQPKGSPEPMVYNVHGPPTQGSDVDSADSKPTTIRSSFRSSSQESRNLRVSFVATAASSGMLRKSAFRVPSDSDLQGPLEREYKLHALINQTRARAYGACIFTCCLSLLALIYMVQALKEVDNARYDEAERLLHKSGIVILISVVTGLVVTVTVFSIVFLAVFTE